MNEKGDALGAVLITIVFVLVAVIFGVSIFADWGFDTGHGQQIGYISEVENNGWIWQPTEITLISVVPTFSSQDTVWKYASNDPEIVDTARLVMDTHDKVVVKYETRFIVTRWDFSHRTVITEIMVV